MEYIIVTRLGLIPKIRFGVKLRGPPEAPYLRATPWGIVILQSPITYRIPHDLRTMHSPIPSIDIERRQKISLREPPVNSIKTVNATTRTTTIVRSSYLYATRGTSDTTGTQKCVHDKTTKTESLVPTSNRTSHHRTQPRPTSEWEAGVRVSEGGTSKHRNSLQTHIALRTTYTRPRTRTCTQHPLRRSN